MENEVSRTNFGVIDIARFVMSLLVIAIHVDTFYPIQAVSGSILFQDITGIAVPFFFVTSGFFFREKSEFHSGKYIYKLLKSYIFWTMIYIPLTIIYYYRQEVSYMASILQFVQRFLFVGENFYSFQLWYLPALVCSVLIYLLGKRILTRFKRNTNIMLLIAVFLFVAGRAISFLNSGQIEFPLISSMTRLYFRIFITTRNGVFYGFAFFMVGVWISENIHKLEKYKTSLLLVLGLISACMNHFGLFFMMIPEITCFWVALKKASNIIEVPNSKAIRKMSELNYYVHLWPLSIISLLIIKFNFWNALIATVLITVLIAVIIMYFQNKIREKR